VIAPDAGDDPAALDAGWTAPAWAALVRGTLADVTLIADGAGAAATWTARRPSLWRRIGPRFGEPDLAALLAAARGDA